MTPRVWRVEDGAPSLAYLNALEVVAFAARQSAAMLEGETPVVLDDALALLDRTSPAGDPAVIPQATDADARTDPDAAAPGDDESPAKDAGSR